MEDRFLQRTVDAARSNMQDAFDALVDKIEELESEKETLEATEKELRAKIDELEEIIKRT
jgi:chaperonin cofactor prefoldin